MAFVLGFLTPQILAAYFVLALIVALMGRQRQIGFWGVLVLSLLLTPVVMGFFLAILSPKKAKRHA